MPATPNWETLSAEFVKTSSRKDVELLVMRVGKINNYLRPFSKQNSLYRLIQFGACFWLLIKFMFGSPGIYTSWSSNLSVSDIAIESLSRKLD